MSIIRGARPDTNFYTLDKRISEDKRLGWSARGLLVYLLGKPDNWRVSTQALINETTEAGSRSGRDAVYGMLKELEDAGYIRREQIKAGGGKFAQVDYIVSEVPHETKPQVSSPHPDSPEAAKPDAAPLTGSPDTAKPHTDKPDTDQPDTAQPLPANPQQTSTDLKQELNRTRTEGTKVRGPKAAPIADTKAEYRAACRATWDAYAEAFKRRYGTDPVRNEKVNSNVCQIVKRLGREEAAQVAEWFVDCQDPYAVKRLHDLAVLLGSAETFRTQWATGMAAPASVPSGRAEQHAAWNRDMDEALANARGGAREVKDMGMIDATSAI